MYYLYDARYNIKTETTLKKVRGLFAINENEALKRKDNFEVMGRHYYLIDENTTRKEIKKIYSSHEMKAEAWKPIKGVPGYFVSNHGRFKRGDKFLMPFLEKRYDDMNRNRQFIMLNVNGEVKRCPVSRIVAYHFVDKYYNDDYGKPKDNKYKTLNYDELVVKHKNGSAYDNCHSNLEWIDRKDLGKITGRKKHKEKTIVAKCAETGETLGHYCTDREVEESLPVSRSSVRIGLKTGKVICGIYKFKYISNKYDK